MSIPAISPIRLTPVQFGGHEKHVYINTGLVGAFGPDPVVPPVIIVNGKEQTIIRNTNGDSSEVLVKPNQIVGDRGAPSGSRFEGLREQINNNPKQDEPNQPPSATSRQGRYISAGNHFKGFLKNVAIALAGSFVAGGGAFVAGSSNKLAKYAALPLMIGGLAASFYGAIMSKYHQIIGLYQAVRGVFAKSADQPAA